MFGIPVSGGPANLASFTPGFLRALGPALPLGVAASAVRNVVYFGGHATAQYVWTLAAWALAGVIGLILVTALRRPARPSPGPPRRRLPRPDPGPPGRTAPPSRGSPAPGAAQPISLVVGFDNSEPARRALRWGADLLRARPGTLHVVYADHVLIDSDLSGFAHAEMEDTRDAEGGRRWRRPPRRSPPRQARRTRSSAARIHPPTRSCPPPASRTPPGPASTPVIVAGRSHHAAHQIIGSVPVRLLHQSPYPVLTIA